MKLERKWFNCTTDNTKCIFIIISFSPSARRPLRSDVARGHCTIINSNNKHKLNIAISPFFLFFVFLFTVVQVPVRHVINSGARRTNIQSLNWNGTKLVFFLSSLVVSSRLSKDGVSWFIWNGQHRERNTENRSELFENRQKTIIEETENNSQEHLNESARRVVEPIWNLFPIVLNLSKNGHRQPISYLI